MTHTSPGIPERLRNAEVRYRRLFEAASDGILLVEPASGRIQDANPALLQLLGTMREQVIGQALWQVGLLPDEPAQQALLAQVQQEGVLRQEVMVLAPPRESARGRVPGEGPGQGRGEEARQVEWACIQFETSHGHEVLQCTLHDLTARRQAEEARLRLGAIVSSSDDAILSKDLNGIITSWNAAAEQLYGYSAEEMVGQPVSRLFPSERQEEELTQIMECLLRGERVDHFETLRVCRDGSLVPVSVTISPIKDSRDRIVGASAIARDISTRKALELQRDAFIGLVTHELLTPLASLQMTIQLAQQLLKRLLLPQAEPRDEAQQQQALEDVLGTLGRSLPPLRVQQRLINDLLDHSRLQEGKLEVVLAPCDLVQLVVDTVQEQQTAHPDRLITLVDLPARDALMVTGDRDRLQQVLGNYLSNALKFAPETAPVRVGITLQAASARVWVQDQGPGLSAKQQAAVWQQFYQVPGMPVQGGGKGGLGLGLYICQHLIRRQHGEVGVESSTGKGATFWFALPLDAPTSTGRRGSIQRKGSRARAGRR